MSWVFGEWEKERKRLGKRFSHHLFVVGASYKKKKKKERQLRKQKFKSKKVASLYPMQIPIPFVVSSPSKKQTHSLFLHIEAL